jgi:hypothetical protein
MVLKHLPPAENTSHRSDGQGMTDGGTGLAPQGHACPGRGSLNHLDSGINQPELKIIDVFICKLCNFSETVWAAPRAARAARGRRARPRLIEVW